MLPALQTRWRSVFLALCVTGVPVIIGTSYLFHLARGHPFLRLKIRAPLPVVTKTLEKPAL